MSNYDDYGEDRGDPRFDALDLIEGVLKHGFSLSSVGRIAQARGPNFWIGAAIGAAAVVLISKPEARAAVAGLFRKEASTEPPREAQPAKAKKEDAPPPAA